MTLRRSTLKRVAKSLVPVTVWNQLSTLKNRGLRAAAERAGYVIASQDDYYSPLPSLPQLKRTEQRWCRPSALAGVHYDVPRMKLYLDTLLARYRDEFFALPRYEQIAMIGFGPGYTPVDALILYLMIRDLKPRRYIEVGSGVSTYYCSLAARKNAEEGHPVEMTCIEPFPAASLSSIPGIRVIADEVQNRDPAFFEQLGERDVLFIDSTHVLRIDGDVAFLYLEVLPILKLGVAVHIHDIPFPYNIPYPPQKWVFDPDPWPKFWNEAMVLQAFLCCNGDFEITLSPPLIRHFDEVFLRRMIPIYESTEENPNAFSSIWLKRVRSQ